MRFLRIHVQAKAKAKAKAKAILWAVSLARQLNVDQMVFEEDSKACIEALSKSKPVSQWRLVSFAEDALRTFRSNLAGISMPRAGNLTAIT